MTLTAVEYGIRATGKPATLRAVNPQLMFAAPVGWSDADTELANSLMASRVLLQPPRRGESFAPNVVIQYFDFMSSVSLKLSAIDTDQDILNLNSSQLIGHHVLVNGFVSIDEGRFVEDHRVLAIRRIHVSYKTTEGKAALSILSCTAPVSDWESLASDIGTICRTWLKTTVPGLS
ncbi:hypothetical protein ACLQ3C_16440 [Gordonia sp. DT30]|uniref:hypothetical protein n=1 Tax=unclassified Gordonia (in: high G+C Gram-positive bacteria) TaxID=2657482 RepID=UPI003CE71E6C